MDFFRYKTSGNYSCKEKEYEMLMRTQNHTLMTEIRGRCLTPCKKLLLKKKLQPSFEDKHFQSYNRIEITFPTSIVVTKSHFIYPLMSFGAEIGGWIGLFLGLSVLDIYDQILQLELNGFL